VLAKLVGKLLYASPAWWGFATASDKQHIKTTFVRQCVQLSLYGDNDPTLTQLAEDADETLFKYNELITSCNTSFQTTIVLWNSGKPSKIRPTVSPRQNIPAV